MRSALLAASAAALLLLSGCGSRLAVRIYRYRMDYAARAAYAAARAPRESLRRRVYRLRTLRTRLADYRAHLAAMSDVLAASTSGAAASAGAPAAKRAQAAIDKTIATIDKALERELARTYRATQRYALHRDAGPIDARIAVLWGYHAVAIGNDAPRGAVVVDEASGEHALRELARSNDAVWRSWAAARAARPADSPLGALARELAAKTAAASAAASLAPRVSDRFAVWMRRARHLRELITRDLAADDTRAPRRAHARRSEGLADPFLAYIAAHPEGFKPLGSGVSVRVRRGRSVIVSFDRRFGVRVEGVVADRTAALQLRRAATLQTLTALTHAIADDARRKARTSRVRANRDALRAIQRYARRALRDKLDASNVDLVIAQLRRRLRALRDRHAPRSQMRPRKRKRERERGAKKSEPKARR
ncbi:MAG: hypothetical protein KC503_16690 [Myxococcales bacterium]|nr:hypothetical protein [Myxococcales bacterium]